MQKTLLWLASLLMVAGMTVGTARAQTQHADTPAWQGQHTMSGTVTAIDHTTGVLSLNTHEGELKLHFPPATVKEVKTGQTLTVSLGFHEGAGMDKGSH